MDYFIEQINNASTQIDRCIDHIQHKSSERLEQATNITNSIRQLTEHCACLVYERNNQEIFDYSAGDRAYDYFAHKAKNYVKNGRYSFLFDVHEYFQAENAHHSNTDDENLRSFLHQFEKLVQIKVLLKTEFNIEILPSLYRFPLDMDETFLSYYRTIMVAIDGAGIETTLKPDYYYVQNQRVIYLDGKQLFEITVYPVMSQRCPTNRIIVFSKKRISSFYAVQLKLMELTIQLFETKLIVNYLVDWSVSIRPCEFEGFDGLMNIASTHHRSNSGYAELMAFLTESYWTLSDIVLLNDDHYLELTNRLFKNDRRKPVCQTLDRLRSIISAKHPGSNVLLYLAASMNDEIIDKQRPRSPMYYEDDDIGGGIHLSKGTLVFDERPIAGKLLKHRPPFFLLARCFDVLNREDELFARELETYSNETGRIYLDCSKGRGTKACSALKGQYNSKVAMARTENRISSTGDFFCLKANEDSTHMVLSSIARLAKRSDANYSSKSAAYLQRNTVEDPAKSNFISNAFVQSSAAFLCGRAGAGKSTALSYLCEVFEGESILVLAQTKPALDRLKRLIKGKGIEFSTVEKATHSPHSVTLLIIDESSVVSNRDLCSVLEKTTFEKVVFAGDPCQLQSIEFGNWFDLGLKIFKTITFELKKSYRGNGYPRLQELWKIVREGGPDIAKSLADLHASKPLGKEIFKRENEDEVVLCLNYNGLYGINCINDYLQSANPESPFEINHRIFKAHDPILFIETARFGSILHNNLKGKILSIVRFDGGLVFRLAVDADLRGHVHPPYAFHCYKDGASEISIKVFDSGGQDDKKRYQDCVIPFQLAYAVSIHKAQGLEYDSVKIVIANDMEERITSNVFYTAITRSKRLLTIFWTPESERKILSNLKRDSVTDDYKIYYQKHPFSSYLN